MSDQIDLFGSPQFEQDPVGLAPSALSHRDLSAYLPSDLRFGTSSWTFPGWRNLVYSRPSSEQVLARFGLSSYAAHPLLRGVGLDRTYYAPIPEGEFGRLAVQVPEDFRFLVKAHAALTTPAGAFPRSPTDSPASSRYLDSQYARECVIEPAVSGLGLRLGTILFQFPPLGTSHVRDPSRFAERLHSFLAGLPRGPTYAVELRNRELLSRDYAQALAAVGASHCFNIHPQMPDVLAQAEMLGEQVWSSRSVAIRWMLHPGFEYEDARRRYFPFDRLVDPDLRSRISLVELVTRVLTTAKDVLVIANNKAEGSAPNTIVKLAEECVRHWQDRVIEEK
jgi:uncharacterized protein YecE (DUF72 family)